MDSFSQRRGYEQKIELHRQGMPDDLRNSLWNIIYEYFKEGIQSNYTGYEGSRWNDETKKMVRVKVTTGHSQNEFIRIRSHPRTLRKAREQVKQMVRNGFSAQQIKSYLCRWTVWWVSTSKTWDYNELLIWFIDACWDLNVAAQAASLLHSSVTRSRRMMTSPGVWNLVPGPQLDQD